MLWLWFIRAKARDKLSSFQVLCALLPNAGQGGYSKCNTRLTRLGCIWWRGFLDEAWTVAVDISYRRLAEASTPSGGCS